MARVLLLERLQALRLVDLHPAVLLAPAEVRGVVIPSSMHTAATVLPRASSTSACLSLLTISSALNRLPSMTCPPEMRRIPKSGLVRFPGGRSVGRTVRDASNPGGEIEVVFTGMRPGEKMFEELVIGAELRPTAHPAVMVAVEGFAGWDPLDLQLQALEASVSQHDAAAVRRQVGQLVGIARTGRGKV